MTSGRHGKNDYMCVYCCTDDLYCDATSVHVCRRPTLVTVQYVQPHLHAPPHKPPPRTPIHPNAHPHIRTHIHPSTLTPSTLTYTHTHTHLDLVQHVSCVVHNDEEWFRLFDGRALEVAVLLVLLPKFEEEIVVISTWEAGIGRGGGRRRGRGEGGGRRRGRGEGGREEEREEGRKERECG